MIDAPNVTLGLAGAQTVRSKMTYNSAGQLLTTEDPEGNVTTYSYFPQADPSGASDPNARTTAPGGYLAEAVVDAVNNGDRTESAPLASIHSSWTYDLVGNRTSWKDGNGNVTTYIVNTLNQVVRRTSASPFSYQTDTFYDANDNVQQVVANNDPTVPQEPVSYTTSYDFDILDNVIGVHRDVGGGVTLTTTLVRNANESVEEVHSPEGNVVRTLYDERELVVSRTRGFGAKGAATTNYFVDANGNLQTVKTPLGHSTTSDHDGFERVKTVTDAVGGKASLSYDPASNVLSALFYGTAGGPSPQGSSGAGNALLAGVSTLYDELSRPYEADQQYFDVRTGAAIGAGTVKTQRKFDRAGRVTRVVNDNGHAVDLGYDGASRRVLAKDALGNEVDVTYDPDSNPVSVVEKEVPDGGGQALSFTTANAFDELDRMFRTTDNAGHVRQLQWDSRGNRVRYTDAEGNVTRWFHDGLDRVTRVERDLKDALGRVTGTIATKQGWDGDSRLQTTKDDNQNVTTYHWDALDRLEEVIYADKTVRRRTFTQDDRVDEETDQNTTTVKNFYDALDRVTSRVVAPARGVATTTTFEKYEWDGLSRMTKGTNDASTVGMAYDSLSRVIEETQNGKKVSTVRDGVGNPVTCSYPGGRQIGRQFDADERVKEIDDGAGGAAPALAKYTWNGPFRPGTRTLANGVADTCLFDNDRRVTSKVHARTIDSSVVCGWQYDYNKEDQKLFEKVLHPSSQGPAGSGEVYQYDSLYRLRQVKYGVANPAQEAASPGTSAFTRQVSYALDGVGNWSGQTTTNGQGGLISFIQPVVDAMNEYSSFGQAGEKHDKNGNRVEFDTPNSSQLISYDFRNRPVAVYQASGAGQGGALPLVASYTYDVFNRRIEKSAANQGDVRFFYDGWRCVEEQDAFGVTLATYVDGPQYLDEHVSMDRGGQRYFFHANTLYSVGALTDSQGNVVERYSYDVYGTPTIENADGTSANRTSSAFGNPFLYTGHRLDPETGFYYARNNYLDPLTGRWISHDSAASDLLRSLYSYVGGNPTNRTDPSGLGGPSPDPPWASRAAEDEWLYEEYHSGQMTRAEYERQAWHVRPPVPGEEGYAHDPDPSHDPAFQRQEEHDEKVYAGLVVGAATGTVGIVVGIGVGAVAIGGVTVALVAVGVSETTAATTAVIVVGTTAAVVGTVAVGEDVTMMQSKDPFTKGFGAGRLPFDVGGVIAAVVMVANAIRGAMMPRSVAPPAPKPRCPNEILTPGGKQIGTRVSVGVRTVTGGWAEANAMFQELSAGGTPASRPAYSGKQVNLPGGGWVALRADADGTPVIDVDIPGNPVKKIHFNK